MSNVFVDAWRTSAEGAVPQADEWGIDLAIALAFTHDAPELARLVGTRPPRGYRPPSLAELGALVFSGPR